MNIFDSLTIALAGHNLIEASAGTGKTYAIASLYVRLIVEKGLMPDNILVVTFTDAATRELRDRIRARLVEARDVFSGNLSGLDNSFLTGMQSIGKNRHWPGNEEACKRLEQALRMFDCAAISTIHGFCSRMLLDNVFESGSLDDTELIAEQTAIIQSLSEDFWRRHFFSGEAELQPLIEANNWTPEGMVSFLKNLVCNPELVVVPELNDSMVRENEKACREAYCKVCSVWRRNGDFIRTLLRDYSGLSRSAETFRPDALDELFSQMDSFVSGCNPYALFRHLGKLTPEFIKKSMLKNSEPPVHELFPLCSELITLVRERLIALRWQLFDFVRNQLPVLKSSRNFRFYNDLLTDLDLALTGPHGDLLAGRIRGRFSAALIDEFQDTDQIQYRIFSRLFSADDSVMFLIGDPKQAIYSFRGADIYAYLKAKEEMSDDLHFTMDLNWRSAPMMVDAVNHMFTWKGDARPLVIETLEYPEVNAAQSGNNIHLAGRDCSPLQMWFFRKSEKDRTVIALERGEPRVVAAVGEETARLLADAAAGKASINDVPIVPSDIAVIVRSHKEAKWIYSDLSRRNIPAVIRSNASVFAAEEAVDLRTVLAAITEPARETTLRRALTTGLFGMNGNDIAALVECGGETECERRFANFRDYHNLWRERGFMVMFRSMMEREGIRGRLLSKPGGERAVTNLLHCGEVLHSEESASRLGMDALYAWFSECVQSPPDGEEHQIRLESDEKAVKILTIHVSKGLEYPIVFCPFSWRGAYISDDLVTCHNGYSMLADFGSDELGQHRRTGLEEALAENARLLYVALTRAKYRCYVAWGKFRYAETSALAYLLHRPAGEGSDLMDTLARAVNSLSDDQIMEDLKSIIAAKPNCICLTENPEGGVAHYERAFNTSQNLKCKIVQTPIETDWKVSSFTSLIGGHRETAELPDYDEHADRGVDVSEYPAPDGSIYAFPRGALAGTFMHSVLEKVDFANADDSAIRNVVATELAASSFKDQKEHWLPAIIGMVRNVIDTLLDDGLCLSDVKQEKRVSEMEFFFPLKFISSKHIADVMNCYGGSANVTRLAAVLNFREQCGMLQGFVDLVFTHNSKYYIIDWKSNHLGNKSEDYSQERMSREMDHKLYTLQYLLYTVALNRYLERRSPGYCYERHFGGTYYLFLRGIDVNFPGNGIYYDLPDAALVRDLTSCLIDCEGN